MSAPFGFGGRRRKIRPTVETVPRIGVGDIARAPFTPSRAREGGEATASTIRVVVNGAERALDVVFAPCNYGGNGRLFFLCGTCSRPVLHLYLLPGDGDRPDRNRLACRRCSGGLTYASQHTRRRGINRARRAREKIGALPGLLMPIPAKPAHVRRDYWLRSIARIAVAEAALAAELHAMIPRVRQRLKHGHSNRT